MLEKTNACIRRFGENRLAGIILQVSFSFLLALFFIGPTVSFPHNRKIQAAAALVLIIATFFYVKYKLGRYEYVCIIYFCILIFWTFLVMGPGWFLDRNLYQSIAALAFTLLLLNSTVSKMTLRIPFIVLCAMILFGFLVLKEDVLADGSYYHLNRNLMPKILLTYAALIAIHDYLRGLPRPVLWPAVLTFIISFLSQSRAGLIFAISYVLLILGVNIFQMNKNVHDEKNLPRSKLASAVFISAVSGLFIFASVEAIQHSRFMTSGLSSNGRLEIYSSFLKELSVLKIITGFQPSILDGYGHLHNSYFQLLATTGIASIPVFCLIVVSLYRLFHQSFLLCGILAIFCMYSFVEYVMFFRIGDFVLFPLLLIACKRKKEISTPRSEST